MSSHGRFTYLAATVLLAIIPLKLIRVLWPSMPSISLGVAPSFLCAAGLLFLVRSGIGTFSQLSLARTAVLVAVVAVAFEVAQVLPLPGVLAQVSYRFDPLDLVASVAGTAVAYFIAARISSPSSTPATRARR